MSNRFHNTEEFSAKSKHAEHLDVLASLTILPGCRRWIVEDAGFAGNQPFYYLLNI